MKNVNNKMSKQKWSTFKKSQIKISIFVKNVKALFAMVNFKKFCGKKTHSLS